MTKKFFILGIICFLFLLMVPITKAEITQEIFNADFETGLGSWQVDNGVWELCLHTTPDDGLGFFYVNTICDGNYPVNTDSRLISPVIDLTGVTLTGDEEVHLRFWQWFSYGDDHGYVQISEDNGVTWTNLGSTYYYSSGWSPRSIDITAYLGKEIRIAFYHISGSYNAYSGWSVDNVDVVRIDPDAPPYTYEDGWGDWSADRGVWNLGTPTAGPSSAHEGTMCAGTVLSGNYPHHTDSRLISPSFRVDDASGDQEIHLRFWQWFSYGDDYGDLQINVYNDATQTWSGWVDLPYCATAADYSNWGPKDVDITAYKGKKVRIAFYHISGSYNVYHGWFIDSIEMIKKVPEPTWDFECGWDDWSADRGVWQVGTPTYGPSDCYNGGQCAGTVLSGKYPARTDSKLISSTIDLSGFTPGEQIFLSFMHWYSYGDDYGQAKIQVYDESTEVWEWEEPFSTISGTSGGWTKHRDEDISSYAGKKIRLGFYHTSGSYNVYPGWYIDQVRITGFPHFCECDINQDTVCDMQDWLMFGEDWGRNDCNDEEVECECDMNKDGKCDMMDWLRFGEDWGSADCLICE